MEKRQKVYLVFFLFLFEKSFECSCSRHLCAGLQPAGGAAAATRGAGAEGEGAGEAADQAFPYRRKCVNVYDVYGDI